MTGKKIIGTLGVLWGIAGFLGLLFSAITRLGPIALESYEAGWTGMQWGVAVLFTLFMAHSEGYKGFHKAFSPRFAARMKHLQHNPKPLLVLFAPLFGMCYFHATKKRKIVAYVLTSAIVLMIIGIKFLNQPWRGIIDCGVVVGLGIGILSVLYYLFSAFCTKGFDVSPELPE